MKRAVVLALVAGCATPQAPVAAARHGEETPAATGTASAPPPARASRSPRPAVREQRKASRGRPFTGLTAEDPGTLNWHALRECESSNNYNDRDSATYRGAYQFDRQTWASVGGHGDPADASPAEQDARAERLYRERGRQPWPVCGRRL